MSTERTEVTLIGGPFDRTKVELTATPYEISVAEHRYVWVCDPDDGAFLGAYAYAPTEDIPAAVVVSGTESEER